MEKNKSKQSGLTASSILNPFVHFIKVPDEIDNCLTGNEKVKPSSLCLPGAGWNPSPSVATNFASAVAIKSNNSWNHIIQIILEFEPSKACQPLTDLFKEILTSDVPVIKCGGIETSSNSWLTTDLSFPPNCTRRTRKFVPPRSRA